MPTGLSALTYIKNNKRRSAVFAVSLALFIAMIYLISYLLSATTTNFYKLLVEQTKMSQVIIPEGVAGMDRDAQLTELAGRLEKVECVNKAIAAKFITPYLTAIVGQYSHEFPLVEKDRLPELLGAHKAVLKEGRMPENPGEILVDELYAKNQKLQIGSNLLSDSYVICGIVQCDTYFVSGIPTGTENISGIYLYSDGENIDFTEIYQSLDLPYDYAYIFDNVAGTETYMQDVSNSMDFPSKLITIVSTLVLAVSLCVVYNLYVRDRYEEWCLYASIGYSAGDIYKLSLRELLFTYGIALTAGSCISMAGVLLMKYLMIAPLGLLSTPVMPETIGMTACILIALIGVCQIPVLTAIQRIKTIDIIEEDEW